MIINYGTGGYRSENTSNYELQTTDSSANTAGRIKLGRMLDSFVTFILKNQKDMWIGWENKLGVLGLSGGNIIKSPLQENGSVKMEIGFK
jgi:hypothetical protein